MKKCSTCKVEKPLTEFYLNKKYKDGLQYSCKGCMTEAVKKRQKDNPGYIKAYQKEWNKNNRPKVREQQRRYVKNNPEKHNARIVRARKRRIERDPTYKSEYNARYRIKRRFDNYRKKGFQDKQNKFSEDLGCTMKEYKVYLESLFSKDMTWDNYGRGSGNWVIDHIVAPSKFDLLTESEFKKAFNYKNTQPMMFSKNSRKSNK